MSADRHRASWRRPRLRSCRRGPAPAARRWCSTSSRPACGRPTRRRRCGERCRAGRGAPWSVDGVVAPARARRADRWCSARARRASRIAAALERGARRRHRRGVVVAQARTTEAAAPDRAADRRPPAADRRPAAAPRCACCGWPRLPGRTTSSSPASPAAARRWPACPRAASASRRSATCTSCCSPRAQPIRDVNTVRKHVSRFKGGRLAAAANGAGDRQPDRLGRGRRPAGRDHRPDRPRHHHQPRCDRGAARVRSLG